MVDWTLYVLVSKTKPVYVGVTSNIEGRTLRHKQKGKGFDKVLEIETFSNKKEAFAAERCLIKYLSVFSDYENLNVKYVRFESMKPYLKD